MPFWANSPTYTRLPSPKEESDEERWSQTDGLLSGQRAQKPYVRVFLHRILRGIVMVFVLLSSYIGVFMLGVKLSPLIDSSNLDRQCLEHTSPYSPVLKHMTAGYKTVQFNGTLGFPSEFTGDPSPRLDAVWDKWAYVKYASIPDEEFNKLPGAKEHFQDAAKLTPEYGGGYIGFTEFSHHMHCLNMLRQGLHQDYYNNPHKPELMAPIFKDRPFTVKIHLQHCIEILRQNVMCNADVGIIPHQWIEQSPDPYANFNTFHKCRDIESVQKWIKDNEIPDTPNGGYLPTPHGAKIFPHPP